MTVYSLTAGGLNAAFIPQPNSPLAWVKLFPGDTDERKWLIQTFPANLSGVTDGSASDQAESYVFFARGSQPNATPALPPSAFPHNPVNGNPFLSTIPDYDAAIPVGSSIELDPGEDWYVAYPIHGDWYNPVFSLGLKANQFVTLVATRSVGSLYENPEPVPSGDSLSSPLGGALTAWAENFGGGNETIPSGAFTAVVWQSFNDPAAFLYAVGGVTITNGINSTPLIVEPGVYDIETIINFFPNTTGNRYVGICFCPAANIGTFNIATAPKFQWLWEAASTVGASGVMPPIEWRGYIPANTYVFVCVYQDSGSALVLINDRSILSIRQVG